MPNCCCPVPSVVCVQQDYTHFHLDPNLTTVDVSANITTFNLALLGVLANLHGNVSPEYRPFVDVLMQAISRSGGRGGALEQGRGGVLVLCRRGH